MKEMKELVELTNSADVLFLMLGAVMVFAMHGGFAFLEVGTVRKKNQVNALVKILSDFAFSAVVYFFIGFPLAYGLTFFGSAEEIVGSLHGYDLVRFFFLLTFAAAIPAIISGAIAERTRFWPQVLASMIFIAFVYPVFEAMVWGRFTLLGQEGSLLEQIGGAPFHDFAGSVVVHAMGGWIALVAVIKLGAREGRWVDGVSKPIPASNIPMMALGTWMLCIGWFGFNVMSAQHITGITGLVAVNSLMSMAGGIIAALVISKNDPGFVHNGALAGLVAVCAGSDQYHPLGALVVGGVAGIIFVKGFIFEQEKLRIDDVLGVWPLHGICGAWGGIACGIFGMKALGGIGDVTLLSQIIGTSVGVTIALVAGFCVYTLIDITIGLRLTNEEEMDGSDLSIHNIGAYPEENIGEE